MAREVQGLHDSFRPRTRSVICQVGLRRRKGPVLGCFKPINGALELTVVVVVVEVVVVVVGGGGGVNRTSSSKNSRNSSYTRISNNDSNSSKGKSILARIFVIIVLLVILVNTSNNSSSSYNSNNMRAGKPTSLETAIQVRRRDLKKTRTMTMLMRMKRCQFG